MTLWDSFTDWVMQHQHEEHAFGMLASIIAFPMLLLAILGFWKKEKAGWISMKKARDISGDITAHPGGTVVGHQGTLVVNFIDNEGAGHTERAVRLGQISAFRQTIDRAAHAWDDQIQAAQRCSDRNDLDGTRDAFFHSARLLGEIITAYKLNRHLFGEQAALEIEKEIAKQEAIATEGNDEAALRHLIDAIQLIHTHSESLHTSLSQGQHQD